MSIPQSTRDRITTAVIVLVAAAQVSALLFLVARPLVTDDLWWSIVLGRDFVLGGPWLADDPLLFAPARPSDPAAWLFDSLLYLSSLPAGLQGLRIFHLVLVLLILGACWRLLRGAGVGRPLSVVGLQVFVAMAAYRLCQLRADLVSILCVLLLVDALIRRKESRPAWSISLAVLHVVWANAHGGFVLGPYIVALATLASGAQVYFAGSAGRTGRREELRSRVRLLILVTVASLANPLGPAAYRRPFTPGDDTPDLSVIADEWVPFNAFEVPMGGLPPSVLTWSLAWITMLLLLLLTLRVIFDRSSAGGMDCRPPPPGTDLFALAWGLLPISVIAIRFLWLGVILALPTLAMASRARRIPGVPLAASRRWPVAIVSVLLAVGFARAGDWPILSPGTPLTMDDYLEPYSTRKYHADAIWILADAGLTGRAFTHYFLSGFMGFWTAPGLRTFINGSMNVPPERVRDYVRIARSYPRGMGPAEWKLLDDHGVTIYVGTGLPIGQDPRTLWRYTTTQLEGSDDWILAFRSARSSIYLRRSAEGDRNGTMLADYYARVGVPFDPATGFDVGRVLDRAPEWAYRHGLIPSDYQRLVVTSTFGSLADRLRARRRLALVYAVLGLYERSADLERRILAESPEDQVAMRRCAWSLARRDRREELEAVLRDLDRHPSLDPYSLQVRDELRHSLQSGRLSRVAAMPLLARHESWEITSGYLTAESRDAARSERMAGR